MFLRYVMNDFDDKKEAEFEENRVILKTALRLVGIAEALFEKDQTKAEIKKWLFEKYNLAPSDETLKLDVNTLIKLGFEVKRGNKCNDFKLHLNKNFTMLKFSHKNAFILSALKNLALDIVNFSEVLKLKKFYEKILPFINEEHKTEISDFKHFSEINNQILKTVQEICEKRHICSLVYNSPARGKVEIVVRIEKIFVLNDKFYLQCIEEERGFETTLRLDCVLDVKKLQKQNEPSKYKEKEKFKYFLSKEFYQNNPLQNNERVIFEDETQVEVELDETNEFIIAQRLIALGKNCLKFENEKIKYKALDILNSALEIYE